MFGRIVALFLGLVLGGGLLEVGARLILPPPTEVTIEAIGQTAPPSNGDPSNSTNEIEIKNSLNVGENALYLRTPAGVRLRPNTVAKINPHETCSCPAEVRTNSLGFRSPELGPKTKPRVIFLGDSVTMADFIPEEKSWVRLVQTYSSSTPTPIESVNAGIWATGLGNYLSVLLDTGLRADPDIVVVVFYLNDVETSPGILVQDLPWYTRKSRALFYLLKALARFEKFSALGTPRSDYASISEDIFNRWREETKERFPFNQTPKDEAEEFNRKIDGFFFDWGSAWSENAWLHMEPIFREFVRLSGIHHFKLVFAIHPATDQVVYQGLYDFPQQRMKKLGAELGVPVIDLLPPLRSFFNSHRDTQLFYDWCHATPAGQEVIAHAMLNGLQESVLKY